MPFLIRNFIECGFRPNFCSEFLEVVYGKPSCFDAHRWIDFVAFKSDINLNILPEPTARNLRFYLSDAIAISRTRLSSFRREKGENVLSSIARPSFLPLLLLNCMTATCCLSCLQGIAAATLSCCCCCSRQAGGVRRRGFTCLFSGTVKYHSNFL